MRLLTILIILFTGINTSYANCQLPRTLEGKTILLRVDGTYTPNNPMADSVQELKFKKHSYQVTILNTGITASGTYRYEYFDPKLARLSVREGKGKKLSLYSETFVCETNRVGYFIFSQTQGPIKPDIRQNTGVYIIE
ncbi:hypothetical protein [Shewanella surugensis]|uniref:Uncharacterized protein n=1 Tax=Shewanella surugensis TaxID=212020 RepID=A0ABT0LHI9_9GAMM|nr:hypothetical protein [Shewanella surugensis]MCL1127166.1 hypothetical protein [Shewanella surugensis]